MAIDSTLVDLYALLMYWQSHTLDSLVTARKVMSGYLHNAV